MKKTTIAILILIALAGCEKLTFDEYYQCEKDYKAEVYICDSLFKYKKINGVEYNARIKAAQKTYDQCIADGENNK